MVLKRKVDLISELTAQNEGLHFTAYVGGESSQGIDVDLDNAVSEAEHLLSKELTSKELSSFLAPVKRLSKDQHILSEKRQGGWALFRSNKIFRLLRIPTSLKNVSVVANSFHIKPMLMWQQNKEENYILSLSTDEASLYESLYGELRLIDTLSLKNILDFGSGRNRSHEDIIREHNLFRIDGWMMERVRFSGRSLIVTGTEEQARSFTRLSEYPNLSYEFIPGTYRRHQESELKRAINNHLHEVRGEKKRKALKQFRRAERQGRVDFDIFSIARNAVNENVKRLYVAENMHIWGLLDRKSGALKVHSKQLNCMDDDLLDDISEVVLRSRAEVVVLPKQDMPMNSPIAAILKPTTQPKFNPLIDTLPRSFMTI